jgi:hypothetical protein
VTQVLQIIGISFNLIIIRVSTNNTIESQYTMQTMDRGAQSLPHGGGGGFNLQFATGPDGAARPSDTGYTNSRMATRRVRKLPTAPRCGACGS